jgi:hypothetical protein
MITDSPQKNAAFRPSLTAGPDFATWRLENLAKFAEEAYDKLRQQHEEIEHLKLDLKAAMEAYRTLLRQAS